MKAIGNSDRIYAPYTVGNAPTNNVAYTDLANAFTLAQSISFATAGTIFTLATTENNATAQVVDLYRHRAGAAGQDGDDLTELQFNGLDDNGTPQKTKYARILAEIVDASDTTEDGRLSLGTMRAGSVVDWQVESGTLRYQGLTLPSTAGFINPSGLQIGNAPTRVPAQIVTNTNVTYQTCSTDLPLDNSVPQNTEGDEILSAAITPNSATSTLVIDISFFAGATSAGSLGSALFSSASASAIDARAARVEGATSYATIAWTTVVSAGSTSARTYSVRLGPEVGGAASARLNGDGSARVFGGVATALLKITEYLP